MIFLCLKKKMIVVNINFLDDAFHLYYEGLHRYAYTMLEDNDMAKDIVQQVFVTLWEKKDTLNITVSVRAYLYRAVYNSCINHWTRERRHLPLNPDSSGQTLVEPEFLSEIRELRTVLERAIETLPSQCKVVFLKSREEGKSYAAIAGELGISVKTVEAQVTKALKILRSAQNK